MKLKIISAAFFFIVMACKEKNKHIPENIPDADSAATFLPVADFIKNDMNRVDSFAGAVLRKANTNGKKDSAYITLPQFHQLARQFMPAELDSASFRGHFEESSLMDETTQLLNFVYTTRHPGWPLQKVIVYLKPSLEVDQVKRIYMEKQYEQGDTLLQQKLTWKTGQYFYVLSIKQPKNGPAVTTMEKVIWDPEYFSEE